MTISDHLGGHALFLRAGDQLCALPLQDVIEIMRPLPITALASAAPPFVLGLAVVRGEPIPVVDLGRLVSRHPEQAKRFVIVAAGARRAALATGEVLGVRAEGGRSQSLQALPPLLGEVEQAAVSAVGTLDAELLLVLRGARLVPPEAPKTPEARA